MNVSRLLEEAHRRGFLSKDQYEHYAAFLEEAGEGALERLIRDGVLSPGQIEDLRGPVPPPARRQIGKYTLIHPLGAGGSAEVWKAYDPELKREVAVKFVTAVDPRFGKRLLREAQAVAKLDHPGIVPIYDVGTYNGTPYVVMRYIEGATIERADLDLRRKVEAIRDAALALHHAHERGIIHRDVKPQNLIVQRGEAVRVFVTDFGLAKQHEVDTSLSVTGAVIGTAHYMSPEQAQGRAGEVDARSDVFSLGATLYQLLTGRAPFSGNTFATVVMSVLHEDPPDPRLLDKSVPADLCRVTIKALEKEPAHRYATAREMAEDLDRWLRGEPVRARPVKWWTRLGWRIVRRPPWVPIGLGLLLAAALTTALMPGRPHPPGEEEAARKIREATLGTVQSPFTVFKPSPGTEPLIERALADLDAAIRENPEHPRAHWFRGIWRMLRGELSLALRKDPRGDLQLALQDYAWVRERLDGWKNPPTDPSGLAFHQGLAHFWLARYWLTRVRRGENHRAELRHSAARSLAFFKRSSELRGGGVSWSEKFRMGQLRLVLAEGSMLGGELDEARRQLEHARARLESLHPPENQPNLKAWKGEAILARSRLWILTARLHEKRAGEAVNRAEALLKGMETTLLQEQAEQQILLAECALLRGRKKEALEHATRAFTLLPSWKPEWPDLE